MRYLFRKGRMVPARDETPKQKLTDIYTPGTRFLFSKRGNVGVVVIKRAKG